MFTDIAGAFVCIVCNVLNKPQRVATQDKYGFHETKDGSSIVSNVYSPYLHGFPGRL